MSGQRATDLMLPSRRDTFAFLKNGRRAPAQDGTPFYREQTLRIVIGTGVAGGFEACARLLTALRRLGWGPGRVSETINEQVSHVGFCRKAEQLQKLGASEMVRIKSIIDKEMGKFERTLKREYQPYWKPRQFVPLRLELQLTRAGRRR